MNNADSAYSSALYLYISSELGADVVVDVPYFFFTTSVTVPPGGIKTVLIPSGVMLGDSTFGAELKENKGVHVTSNQEVTVYGLNRVQYTTDGFLGLPVSSLGMTYRVLSYTGYGSMFALVGTQDNTTVSITPKQTVGGHAAGVPFSVVLNTGQTYQLALYSNTTDLTGTYISSDKPVAAFGGHECANVPLSISYCDHLAEQHFPLSSWGKNFVTYPLALRTAGDVFRILADQANTVVTINGSVKPALAAGNFIEISLSSGSVISATKPVLVAQYCKGTQADGVKSDPFEALIPPVEQFSGEYTFTTPSSGFSKNYVNVVLPQAGLGSLLLDGAVVATGLFAPIGSSGYYGAKLPIALNTHSLSCPVAFGVLVYGYDSDDSYGYPGGLQLGAVATVASLSLSPKTGSHMTGAPHCVTVTVLDGFSGAVPDVRVDFTVSGPNPSSGYVFTDSSGNAVYCWQGVFVGQDTVQAHVGSLSDTGTMDWLVNPATATPTHSRTPTFTVTPTRTPTPSRTPSNTRTVTLTSSPTRTASPTFTVSPTFSATRTRTPTRTATPSFTDTWTPSATRTFSATKTFTPTFTITRTFSASPTFSVSPTITPTQKPDDFDGEPRVIAIFPQPVTSSGTFVGIHLPYHGQVTLNFYDLRGELVRSLSQSFAYAGDFEIPWDAKNNSGNLVAYGAYLLVAKLESGSKTKQCARWFTVVQ